MAGLRTLTKSKMRIALPILAVAIPSGLAVHWKLKAFSNVTAAESGHPIMVVRGRSAEVSKMQVSPEPKNQAVQKINLLADGTTILKAFNEEQLDRTWAAGVRQRLERSISWPRGITVTEVECKTSTCAISGLITEGHGVNIDNIISAIEGDDANDNLKNVQFVGQRSAIYTVKAVSPLSVSFTKFVQEAKP